MKVFFRTTIFLLATGLIVAWVFRSNISDFCGYKLMQAAGDGDLVRVRVLLFIGTDINYCTGSGSALHYAAANGDIRMMKFLLAHGAAADQGVKFGVTPLYRARGHPEAEKLLLDHGANPNISDIRVP